MKLTSALKMNALAAGIAGALLTIPAFAATSGAAPSGVNESAPARTGPATSPSGAGGGASQPGYPPNTPSGVSPSAPATTGPASTPTHGQGQSAPSRKADAVERLPKTPSSVSESAPARTGSATVPTARSFEAADLNKDGMIDRSEYQRMFPATGATR